MTVVTLRPDSTLVNTGPAVKFPGSDTATPHVGLNDDSDTTYVSFSVAAPGDFDQLVVGLTAASIPATAAVKRLVVRLRTDGADPGPPYSNITILGHSSTISGGWVTPTTAAMLTADLTGVSGTDIDAANLSLVWASSTWSLLVYEAYVDVIYVAQPIVSVTAPVGEVDDTNLPAIRWERTLDADGGYTELRYEVEILDDADAVVESSGTSIGPAISWWPTTPLPDGDYTARVRVAQLVNGALHWSDWDTSAFSIAVDLPAAPLFFCEPDTAAGWVALEVYAQEGDATTDLIELQRSADAGTTWQTIRTKREDGYVLDGEGPIDWEAPIGVPLVYRVRAVHDYAGVYAASAWVTAETQLDTTWWLRHPINPDLALPIAVHSFKTTSRAVRQTVHNPLGRAAPVVVSDVRGLLTGTIVIRTDTPAERVMLDRLLDSPPPLLLRGPAEDDWIDSYVAIGDAQRERFIDKAFIRERLETLPITVVDRPPDVATDWPDAMLLEAWLIADGGTPLFTPPEDLDGGTP